MAPPRTLKSLMASVAFPAYLLGRNPGARIIGISHSSDLQIGFGNHDCRERTLSASLSSNEAF